MSERASFPSGGGDRDTPYSLVFAGRFEDRIDAILAEAADRGIDPADPERLIMLTEAGRLLRDLLPDDADPSAVLELGALVFQAVHFKRAGLISYLLDAPALRLLLEGVGSVGQVDAPPPSPAGYLQLPRNAVWAQIGEVSPWEPVDGVFWALPEIAGPAPLSGLQSLLALGLRPDRPGFSVAAVAVPPGEEQHWNAVEARPEGPDFANQLPGGDLAGLHALVNRAEVLKLLARFFRLVAERPETLERDTGVAGSAFQVRGGGDGR